MTTGTIGVFINTEEQIFLEMNITSTENNAEARLAQLAEECEQVSGSALTNEAINQVQFKLEQIIDLNAWASQASIYLDSMKKMLSLKNRINAKQHWSTDEITLAYKDVERCSLPKLKKYFLNEMKQLKDLYNYASYVEVNLNESMPYSFIEGLSGYDFLKKIEPNMDDSYKKKISLVKEFWLKNIIFENKLLHNEVELINILRDKNLFLDEMFSNFQKATSIQEAVKCLNEMELISYNRQNSEIQSQVAQAIYAKKEELNDYNSLFKWSSIFVMRFSRKEAIVTDEKIIDFFQKAKTSEKKYTDVLTLN